MSSLVFKKLIIFSPLEDLAKQVDLKAGLNIITSQKKDGNDLGKSILAKSFYHCLGADCRFDDDFNHKKKVFILKFEYGKKTYTIYRNDAFFKIFDSKLNILWASSHRHELGEYLYDQFGFAIWLPSRETRLTEITPPAYSFAPYFIDQNQYHGSDFKSFENLTQYSNFKSDLIYTFLGAYDKDFHEIKARKESLEKDNTKLQKAIELSSAMLRQVSEELTSMNYNSNMNSLSIDCDLHENEYKSLSKQLNDLRIELYKLREQRAQVKYALDGAKTLEKQLNNKLNKFNSRFCPVCNSIIDNPLYVRVSACVTHSDFLILTDDFVQDYNAINKKIIRQETKYKNKLEQLNSLKASMDSLRAKNMTAAQIEGLTKFREKLSSEHANKTSQLELTNESLKIVRKELKKYDARKKKVNDRYIEVISQYVSDLNLQSIELRKNKNIGSKFSASGSNTPLATVAWYFSLLKLKEELNPDRTCLPLILDSPLNVEADDEKYERQYSLIFEKFKYEHQMIVTGLGLAQSTVVPIGANVIVLENKKYELLNKKDYEEVKELVFSCMEQQIIA